VATYPPPDITVDRIGELVKLGITISQASVAKYMVRHRKRPSQTWKTFLTNHAFQPVSADFFRMHTICSEILFVLVGLAHDRRQILHFDVTAYPTADWTAQQMVEALPFDSAPKYLLRAGRRPECECYWQQSAALKSWRAFDVRWKETVGSRRDCRVFHVWPWVIASYKDRLKRTTGRHDFAGSDHEPIADAGRIENVNQLEHCGIAP